MPVEQTHQRKSQTDHARKTIDNSDKSSQSMLNKSSTFLIFRKKQNNLISRSRGFRIKMQFEPTNRNLGGN
jgi:hypothetical protein